MSTARTPEPVAAKRVAINAPRLWGGGLATAVVAALVAVVGVLVCRDPVAGEASSSLRCFLSQIRSP